VCGVAGLIAHSPGGDVSNAIRRLSAELSHRGPDGDGLAFFSGRSIALGHRRLSILDLEGGAQPMANERQDVWVTYNGEIYNHISLRHELERSGHRFRTRSDTEVLVHGWEEWGPALFGKLNGIFALALLDQRNSAGEGGRIVLARDPLGVKPLYVGDGPEGWWFASELAAALRADVTPRDTRSQALFEYLVYRFIPSPGTFFKRAWKLPPSHWCELLPLDLPSSPTFHRYDPGFSPCKVPSNRSEWAEALRAALTAAVRRQLMSDVPVGMLLSGGVDSTLITRLMQAEAEDPPQGFAVGLESAGLENEVEAAKVAAKALSVPLRTRSVSDADYLQAWPEQIRSLGEPIANSGSLLLGILCQAVRRSHKVVLSGQGADEPLGGYPRHVAERHAAILHLCAPLMHVVPQWALDSDRVSRLRRIARTASEVDRFVEILAVFSPAEANAMAKAQGDPTEPVKRWLSASPHADSLNRLLYVDARLSLADDLLLVGDHMSMRSSVELRVPFLDLEFLQLVEQMPSSLKVSWMGERKWFYRKAVRSLLPKPLRSELVGWKASMGRKQGFTTPLDRWFAKWLNESAERELLGRQGLVGQVLDPVSVKRVIDQARTSNRPRQLMSLYVLEEWLRGLDGPAARFGLPWAPVN